MTSIDADGAAGANDSFVVDSEGIDGLSIIDIGADTLVRLHIGDDAVFQIVIVIADGAVRAATYTAADFNH